MSLARSADHLHKRIRSHRIFQRFTLLCRTLLALGFISPGLSKVVGDAFAPGIDRATPMGAFFEAFHGIGPYYLFVGAAQVLAALLLLSRRAALLGAVLYFPIIVNICVLTVATGFSWGTQMITVAMVLACLWLLVWDAHRLAGIFSPAVRPTTTNRVREPALWELLVPRPGEPVSVRPTARWALRGTYAFGFTSAMIFLLTARGHFGTSSQEFFLFSFYPTLIAGPLALAGWALWWMEEKKEPGVTLVKTNPPPSSDG